MGFDAQKAARWIQKASNAPLTVQDFCEAMYAGLTNDGPEEPAPTPTYKLEAGCTVRVNCKYIGIQVQGNAELEVRHICGEHIGARDANGLDYYLNMGGLEVTTPATPEAGDYVYIPSANEVGTLCSLASDGGWFINSELRTNKWRRYEFTIIAKARHVKQSMRAKQDA